MKRLFSTLAVALAWVACVPAGAQADFGLSEFDVTFTEADETPSSQAGAHPFATTISLGLNADGDGPDGRLRDLFLDLAPGLAVNATLPRCASADFINDECPPVTVVGIADSSFGEPGQNDTAPIFNLVPPEGALLRLGFRLGGENVFLDAGPSPDPPHNLIAEVSDIPEAIELFGVGLELWGEPSSGAHDAARGGPVATQTAFLTSPRSCEGPLSSFADVVSWDAEEEIGESITHDFAGDPMGFTGCGKLSFQPQVKAQPTTDAAQTATGFDLSIAFAGGGLLNPDGIAESDLRELALFLPEEMAAGSALLSGAGACSQAAFEAEGPEDAPDAGCPATSKVGTVEVESALLGDPVAGVVFRGVPFANQAEDSPMALYLVLRDAARGILVKQAIGLETDPEVGYLVALAEEIPELPFEHLQLHLSAGSGMLVSPPRCGEYEGAVALVPRSDDLFVTDASFEIVSGPNGGPCPADGEEPGAGGGGQAPSPPAGTPPPVGTLRVDRSSPRKRPCAKGKRRVRRNGKVRCIKRKKSKASQRRRGHRGR